MANNANTQNKKTAIIAGILIGALILAGIAGTAVFLKDRGSTEAVGIEEEQTSRDVNQPSNVNSADNPNSQPNSQPNNNQTQQNPAPVDTNQPNANQNGNVTTNNANEPTVTTGGRTPTPAATTENIQDTTITRYENVEIPEKQVAEGHYVGWTPMEIDADLGTADIIDETVPDEFETKKEGPEKAKQGDEITYKITVKNNSGRDVKNIEVKDNLDSSILDVTTIKFEEGSEGTVKDNTIIWNIEEFKNNTEMVFEFRVTVKTNVVPDSILKNSVITNGKEIEPIETNIEQATVDVPVVKVWENVNSDAAKAHKVNGIKVTLTPSGKTTELNEQNSWKDTETFTKLPKYDRDGNTITYTVSEEGATQEDKDNMKYYSSEIVNGKITNTFDPSTVDDTIDVPVEKVWENIDSDAAKAHKVNGIKVTLTPTGKTTELNEQNSWKDNTTFTKLPKYDEVGNTITYTVSEEGATQEDKDNMKYYNSEIVDGKITNTFDPSKVDDTIDVPVEKVWENVDSDAAKAHKVNGIKVTLTPTGKTTELNEQNSWKDNTTFTKLPKYDEAGNTITYTVSEEGATQEDKDNMKYYTSEIVDGKITNTFDPSLVDDTVDVPVEKVWKNVDSDAAKAHKVNGIKVTLTPSGKTTELNEQNSWKDTFTKLPKYDEAGNTITYTVSEEGATQEDKDNMKYYKSEIVDGKITNTFDPSTVDDTVDVPVEKVWENVDSDAAKAHKVNGIKVTLTPSGKTTELNEQNSWKDNTTFTKLPKYDDKGNTITYTVSEEGATQEDKDNMKYYTSEIVDGKITNTFDPSTVDDTVDVPVEKVWENVDSDAAKAHKVNGIKVTLSPSGKTTELNEQNSWKDNTTFTKLPKYDEAGNTITYTVSEEGATQEDKDNMKYYESEIVDGKITNTFDPSLVDDTVDVPVVKVWENVNSDAAKAHKVNGIKVTLTPSGKTTELNEQNSWKDNTTFTKLPKYDEAGNTITYTVSEEGATQEDKDNMKYYTSEIVDGKITNTFDPSSVDDTVDVPVEKVWENVDSDAAKAHKVNGIKVTLTPTGKTTELNEQNSWKDNTTFTKLPKYDEVGNTITYTVSEEGATQEDKDNMKYYTSEIVDGKITNTFDPSSVDDTVDVPVEKVWKNVDSIAAKAHKVNGIKVTLTPSGKTTELNEQNSWKDTFTKLPKYDEAGNTITYTVSEEGATQEDKDNMKYYESEIVDGKITNTFNLELLDDKVDVKVTKNWEDNSNTENRKDIVVQLYAGTNAVEGKTVTISANDTNLTKEFKDLDKYSSDGMPINYTVKETTKLEKYLPAVITGNMDDGYVITNSLPSLKVDKKIVSFNGSELEKDENGNDIIPSVTKGDIIGYSIEVTNTGTTDIKNVKVTDTLNNGVTISLDESDLNGDGDINTYVIDTLGTTDTTKTVTIGPIYYTVQENDVSDVSVNLVNTATATATYEDATGGSSTIEETDDVPVSITEDPSINITKTQSINGTKLAQNETNTKVIPNTVLTYEITVENTGNNEQKNVKVSDVMKVGNDSRNITISSVKDETGADVQYTIDNDGTIIISSINVNKKVIITATYTVQESDMAESSQIIDNKVTVDSDNPGDGDHEDEVTVPTEEWKTEITLYKNSQLLKKNPNSLVQSAEYGDTIKYTITATNTGKKPGTIKIKDSMYEYISPERKIRVLTTAGTSNLTTEELNAIETEAGLVKEVAVEGESSTEVYFTVEVLAKSNTDIVNIVTDADNPEDPGHPDPGNHVEQVVTITKQSETQKIVNSNIVLVMDISGSMNENDGTRLDHAKTAAKELIDAVNFKEGSTLSVVTFSSKDFYGTDQLGRPNRNFGEYADNAEEIGRIVASESDTTQTINNKVRNLKNTIDGLEADGGTRIAAGLAEAKTQIESLAAQKPNNKNVVIVLSDGDFKLGGNVLNQYTASSIWGSYDYYVEEYSSDAINKSGGETLTRIRTEASNLKNSSAHPDVWTIAYGSEAISSELNVLRDTIASSTSKYKEATDSLDSIKQAFREATSEYSQPETEQVATVNGKVELPNINMSKDVTINGTTKVGTQFLGNEIKLIDGKYYLDVTVFDAGVSVSVQYIENVSA